MRLGKRERALLKQMEHNQKVVARKAAAVPDTGGRMINSQTILEKRVLRMAYAHRISWDGPKPKPKARFAKS